MKRNNGGVVRRGADCLFCAYVLKLDQEAERLKEDGKEAESKRVKDRADRLRAKEV